MTSFTYGRKITGNDAGWGYTGENASNLRATVFGAMPSDGVVYKLGLRCGYYDYGDPVDLKLAIYDTASGNPKQRLGVTGKQTVNTRMLDAYSGSWYELSLTDPVLVESGKKYGLALLSDGGRLMHGQNVDGTRMYFRDYSPSTPPDPMGYSSSSAEGKISIWALIWKTNAPDLPSNCLPADGASVTSTTPTFAADFTDDDETLPNGVAWDRLTAYRVRVRSVSADNDTTGAIVWDSNIVTASQTERDSRRFSIASGLSLTPGQRYQWSCAVQDRAGNWSAWTNWTSGDFAVASLGTVTLDGNPSGKIEVYSGQSFQWRWYHAMGLNANRVQIRLLSGDPSGTLIGQSAELTRNIASSALPGTLDTITWAETGFGVLTPGAAYGYQVRARDSSNNWTPYTERRFFSTNAYPTVPTGMVPATSDPPVTVRPLLSFVFSDADDTIATGLTAQVRIKNSSGTVLYTRTATYNASTGRWEYQTDATDLASYATYRWDAQSYDGTVYSAYSAEQTFVYAQGPVVAITSPTEGQTIITGTPTIAWTVTGQVKKRVQLWDDLTGALLHDTGDLTDGVASYQLPSGLLRNTKNYRLVVTVTDGTPLSGASQVRRFSLVYTPPATVAGFVATPDYADYDDVPSAVLMSWEQADPPVSGTFLGYALKVRWSGQPFSTAMPIAFFSNIEQTSWIYFLPPSGAELTYSIEQFVDAGLDRLSSAPAESAATVSLRGSVLCDARSGGTTRVVFDAVKSREDVLHLDQSELGTWDGGPPWIYEGPAEYDTLSIEGKLRRTADADLPELIDQVRALAGRRADGSPVVACYRDELGRKRFVRVRNPRLSDQRLRTATAKLDTTSTIFSEEVALP